MIEKKTGFHTMLINRFYNQIGLNQIKKRETEES